MAIKELQSISKLLAVKENKILEVWIKAQTGIKAFKEGLITEKKLREESSQFLGSLVKAMYNGNLEDITTKEYEKVIKFLADLSLSRASEGFSPSVFFTIENCTKFHSKTVPLKKINSDLLTIL